MPRNGWCPTSPRSSPAIGQAQRPARTRRSLGIIRPRAGAADARSALGRCWPTRPPASASARTQLDGLAAAGRAGRPARLVEREATAVEHTWPGCGRCPRRPPWSGDTAILVGRDGHARQFGRPVSTRATSCSPTWSTGSWSSRSARSPGPLGARMSQPSDRRARPRTAQLRAGPRRAGPGGPAAGVRRGATGGVTGPVGARRAAGRDLPASGSTAPRRRLTPLAAKAQATVTDGEARARPTDAENLVLGRRLLAPQDVDETPAVVDRREPDLAPEVLAQHDG